jgi:DNA polymerase
LNNLIESIGLKREESFITNIVKHRPPENRDPLPDEVESCNRWLDEQIDIINPKIIITLGRFSMAKFIQGVTISKVHGQARSVNGKIIIPMFHPAAALRDGSVMAAIREDFKKIPLFLSPNTESIQKNNPREEIPKEDTNEKTQLPLGFDQDQQ